MLECNIFTITEHNNILTATRRYDINNAITGEVLGQAIEKSSPLAKVFRWVIRQQFLPTTIEVREKPDDSLLFTINCSRSWLRGRIEVRDANQHLVGYFASRCLITRGGFTVYDQTDQPLAQVQGHRLGFPYKFLTADRHVELGEVSKSLGDVSGLASERLLSADNYFLTIHPDYTDQPLAKMLLLAAALVINTIDQPEPKENLDPVDA
ncbi:MAG: hypothetical protein RMJ56_10480 [Gemmataceae bacterium]|nr:hypothetical protein [Gemmata sp.]MDW8198015.1 hypothetical protein [Gemmataceae bacterium]